MAETSQSTAPAIDWSQVRFYRKWWFFAIFFGLFLLLYWINVLVSWLFAIPALILIWSGPIYLRWRGKIKVYSLREKIIFTVLAVGLSLFGVIQQGKDTGGVAGQLPECTSRMAADALQNAVKNSPAGRTRGLELISLRTAHELSVTPSGDERECIGSALTNAGERGIAFSIKWIDAKHQRWFIEYRM